MLEKPLPSARLAWKDDAGLHVRFTCPQCRWPALQSVAGICLVCGHEGDLCADVDRPYIQKVVPVMRGLSRYGPFRDHGRRMLYAAYRKAERAARDRWVSRERAEYLVAAERLLGREAQPLDLPSLRRLGAVICTNNWQFEDKHGTYDISESKYSAGRMFDHMFEIKADTVEEFLDELRDICGVRRMTSGPMDGQYSGGKGTYGSILRCVEATFNGDIPPNPEPYEKDW